MVFGNLYHKAKNMFGNIASGIHKAYKFGSFIGKGAYNVGRGIWDVANNIPIVGKNYYGFTDNDVNRASQNIRQRDEIQRQQEAQADREYYKNRIRILPPPSRQHQSNQSGAFSNREAKKDEHINFNDLWTRN